ncbi:MAG: radical SAM protein [Fimbriimonadaceae bacterium]|nr:radical SAM protein [Fimbriimonadaceae bacterium]
MSYKAARLAQLAAVKERPATAGPERVIWQITRACDLCCGPCRPAVFDQPSPRQLAAEEALDLIDQIRRCGQPELLLTGGDPLKRPDLLTLVLYANRVGLEAGLTLSGTPRTTPRMLGLLRSAGLSHITFCLDGPTAAVHDAFRRVDGSYQWTIDGIRVAQAIGLPIRIETSVTAATVDHLDALAQWVGRLGAKLWQVTFGNRPERDPGDSMTAEAHVAALERLAALQGIVNFRVRIMPATYFGLQNPAAVCLTPWIPFELFVADDGAVQRWNSGQALGNVRDLGFAEIVRRGSAQHEARCVA